MRVSLIGLVRLLGLSALAVSAVAVGIARVVPDVPVFRAPAAPRYFGINGSSLYPPLPDDFLLDAETGELAKVPVGPGERIDHVTCSPWTAEPGGFELVARLQTRDGHGGDSFSTGTSLIRFGPSGRRETHSPLDEGPTIFGRPCWLPGEPTTLLMAGGDGRLYRVKGAGGGSQAGPDFAGLNTSPGKEPVGWACPPPGDLPPLLSDPIAPAFRGWAGRVIVTLSTAMDDGGRPRFGPPELWWLQLDDGRRAILAAGRLLDPEGEPQTPRPEEAPSMRMANLAETPDGRVVVAFLARSRGTPHRLLLGEVVVDEAGVPSVAPGGLAEAGQDVAAVTPPLSPDGRWVYAVGRDAHRVPRVERRSVAALLGSATPPAHSPVRHRSRGGH